MTTIACVLRSGGDFLVEHVNRLAAGLLAPGMLTPERVVVLTDQSEATFVGCDPRPLRDAAPGWWAKLDLFAPWNQDLGDLLYLDLDTVVVGPLTELARSGELTMLRDFYRPSRPASGVMFLPAGERPRVWAVWRDSRARLMRRFPRGDGDFLAAVWAHRRMAFWQDKYPGQVVSYKVHVRPMGEVPADARLVCFHGRPRPWAADRPTRDELLRRTKTSLYAEEG